MKMNISSVKDLLLQEVEDFLRKKNIYLLDKKDEISILIRENLDGKAKEELETAILTDLRNDNIDNIAKSVSEIVSKSTELSNGNKVELYFCMKKAISLANKYLTRKEEVLV